MQWCGYGCKVVHICPVIGAKTKKAPHLLRCFWSRPVLNSFNFIRICTNSFFWDHMPQKLNISLEKQTRWGVQSPPSQMVSVCVTALLVLHSMYWFYVCTKSVWPKSPLDFVNNFAKSRLSVSSRLTALRENRSSKYSGNWFCKLGSVFSAWTIWVHCSILFWSVS